MITWTNRINNNETYFNTQYSGWRWACTEIPDCPVMSSAPVIFAGVVMPKNLLIACENHRQQILFWLMVWARTGWSCIVSASKLPPAGGNFLLGKWLTDLHQLDLIPVKFGPASGIITPVSVLDSGVIWPGIEPGWLPGDGWFSRGLEFSGKW